MRVLLTAAAAAILCIVLSGCSALEAVGITESPEKQGLADVRESYPDLAGVSDDKLTGMAKVLCEALKNGDDLLTTSLILRAAMPEGYDEDQVTSSIGLIASQTCSEDMQTMQDAFSN